jgi:hypothetical protein
MGASARAEARFVWFAWFVDDLAGGAPLIRPASQATFSRKGRRARIAFD